MLRFENKNVLVTGASKGIGKAVAELFSEEGENVIVADIDDESGEKVATEIDGTSLLTNPNM